MELITMTNSIQQTWDKFERWQKRYTKVCDEAIDEIIEIDEYDSEGLFLLHCEELECGYLDVNTPSKQELQKRIQNKINFLRGYLVDISFDGPQFMSDYSSFISMQYPSRCNNAYGVWLDQWSEIKDEDVRESGDSRHFQGIEIGFFCNSLEDVDLESMNVILPFQRVVVRRPQGKKWDTESSDSIISQVNADICDDGYPEIQVNKEKFDEFLTLNLIWDQ